MTRGSSRRTDITTRALDAETAGRGSIPVTPKLLRLGAALILGLAFLFAQVAEAAGAEAMSQATAVAADPLLASEAPEPETPLPPPEVEPPPPDAPEPAPTEPPDTGPAPAPSEPPQAEPAPAPSEPRASPRRRPPSRRSPSRRPRPPNRRSRAPAPSEPLEPDDEQIAPPPATPVNAPNVDAGDADGSAEEPSRALRSGVRQSRHTSTSA